MKYILDPYLPAGQVHVLAGSAGSGKTTLLLQALADPRFNWGRVLYVGADRTGESYQQLVARLGLKLPHVTFYSLVDEMSARIGKLAESTPRVMSLLGSKTTDAMFSLSQVERMMSESHYDVLVLDPAAPLLPITNFNDMKQVAHAFVFLAAWIKHVQATLIGVFHTNKTKKEGDFLNVMNRISGSHGILGYASTKAILMGPSEGGPALAVQGQHFADVQLEFHRGPSGSLELGQSLVQEVSDGLNNPILPFIPPNGQIVGPADIVLASNLSDKTVRRHLDKLIDLGLVVQVAHGQYRMAPAN